MGSAIKNTYNAVEPWVQYGFELATYAVGWVPYVGWLSPQIMIFYNFGERIARSITFNIADWLDGNVSFVQGVVNVGVDTINSFIFLANDQLAFWLPPLPPIPPIGPFAAASATTEGTSLAATTATTAHTARPSYRKLPQPPARPTCSTPALARDTGDDCTTDTAAEAIDVASVPSPSKSALKTTTVPTEATTPQTDITGSSPVGDGEAEVHE